MNVYPVNAIEAASLSSEQKSAYSMMGDLYNKYLAYTADFTDDHVIIEGTWTDDIPFNSFIIANSNAIQGTFTFYNDNAELARLEFNNDEYIKIVENKPGDVLTTIKGKRFVLELSGTEDIHIGYIYIGEVWVLPQHNSSPAEGLKIRSESNRSFSGQVTGIPAESLRSFSCSYTRMENKDKKLYDRYLEGVQFVVPHVIDPYSEAHDEFEPMFCTVSEYGEKEKRDESGFYWNFSISWLEAK